MNLATQTEVWPTNTPLVVSIAPASDPIRHFALMKILTDAVQDDLGWGEDVIENIGLTASTPEQVTEGLYFLDDLGIDPRMVTLLVMWGETFDATGFNEDVPVECGTGFIALPKSGVVLPVLRLPSVGDWWLDPLHQVYAHVTCAEMVREGRVRPTGDEPMTMIDSQAIWN
jgi:hypothetical protein